MGLVAPSVRVPANCRSVLRWICTEVSVVRLSSLVVAVTLAVSVTACAKRTYHTSAGEVETAEPRSLLLTVENENFYDMNVYVVSGALGTRVGMVSGNSHGSFVVNR